MTTVGLISDTHSLLRPEAIQALEGADLIVHAGDIGSIDVIDGLAAIAPVHAVRGGGPDRPCVDVARSVALSGATVATATDGLKQGAGLMIVVLSGGRAHRWRPRGLNEGLKTRFEG